MTDPVGTAAPPEVEASSSGCPFHGSSAPEPAATERSIEHLPLPPGPPPSRFLGWRGNAKRFFTRPIAYMGDLRRTHGDVASLVSTGNPPMIYRPCREKGRTVFAFGPDLNREVLTRIDTFDGGDLRTARGCEWLNGSMTSSSGERRAQRRGILSPAFTRDHLTHYYDHVVEQTASMLDGWQGKEIIDLPQELYGLAARLTSICFYGQSPDGGSEDLAAALRRFAMYAFSPVATVPINLPGTPYNKLIREVRNIRRILDVEIAKKRSNLEGSTDLLAMLLRAQVDESVRLSDEELLGESVALYLAGHDVPANAATYSLLLLSQNPEAVAGILDEGGGELPTYKELWGRKVMDRTLKECLRLLGPTLFTFRLTQADCELGGYFVPEGSEVLTSPYMTHLDPEIWEEPKRFRLDRWEGKKVSQVEYLPFSYGPRRCLGAPFAEMFLKTVLGMILRRYRITPVDGTRVDFGFTFVINPKGPIPVRIQPQDGNGEASRVTLTGDIAEMVDFGPRAG